jgi:HTH-type transcriptional regulator/antitoxin HigA
MEALAFNTNRTAEQTAVYKLLVLLVEAYEAEHYPMSEISPVKILNHILEAAYFRNFGTELHQLRHP